MMFALKHWTQGSVISFIDKESHKYGIKFVPEVLKVTFSFAQLGCNSLWRKASVEGTEI